MKVVIGALLTAFLLPLVFSLHHEPVPTLTLDDQAKPHALWTSEACGQGDGTGQSLFFITAFENWLLEGDWNAESPKTGVERFYPIGNGSHAVVLNQPAAHSVRVDVSISGEAFLATNSLIVDATHQGAIEFKHLPFVGEPPLGVYSNVQYIDMFDNCWKLLISDPATGCWIKKCKTGEGKLHSSYTLQRWHDHNV